MTTPSNVSVYADCSDHGVGALSLYAVTVNYNSSIYIESLIESLTAVTCLNELVIVDHSPNHEAAHFSANFPITIIRQPNRGYGAGVNRGIRHLSERDGVVLVCNPDVKMLTPRNVEAVLKAFEADPTLAAIAPAIRTSSNEHFYSCRRFLTWKDVLVSRMPFVAGLPHIFRRKLLRMDEEWDKPFQVEWASGCALFFRLQFFPFSLCFDERFFLYFEDVDICAQIHQQGLLIRYFPRMAFQHEEQRQSARNYRHSLWLLASLIKFISKYRGLPTVQDLRRSHRSRETAKASPILL